MAFRLLVPILRRKAPVYKDPLIQFVNSYSSTAPVPSVPPSLPPSVPSFKPPSLLPPPPPPPPPPASLIPIGDDDKEEKKDDEEEDPFAELDYPDTPKRKSATPKDKPRFKRDVRQACWEKAAIVSGRDPSRWRKDKYGNIVCHKQSSGYAMTAFQYDHIKPTSSGTVDNTLENCEILLAIVNNYKSDKDRTTMELLGFSPYYTFSEAELDAIEINQYFNLSKPVLAPDNLSTDAVSSPEYKLVCKCYKKRDLLKAMVDRLPSCNEETELEMKLLEK